MITVLVVVILLFFAYLFFATKRSMSVKACCKLPFVNLSLEAQQPQGEVSEITPSTSKR